jgi:hypothetical protein
MQSGSRGGTNKQLLSTYENYSVQMIDAGKLAVMFSGINICRNAPSVSHLLFVDDSLILCKNGSRGGTNTEAVAVDL